MGRLRVILDHSTPARVRVAAGFSNQAKSIFISTKPDMKGTPIDVPADCLGTPRYPGRPVVPRARMPPHRITGKYALSKQMHIRSERISCDTNVGIIILCSSFHGSASPGLVRTLFT